MHAESIAATEAIGHTNQAANSVATPALPSALAGGAENTHVYIGRKNGKAVYSGITTDISRRQYEHRDRFAIEAITGGALVRGAARAIEQALIVRNRGQNKINSISPKRPFYQEAVDWGEAWLRGNGLK
jgi:predicted GIY-YIG superfamily endonuclease